MSSSLAISSEPNQEDVQAEIIRRFSNDDILFSLVQKAVHEAVMEHKRSGNPVAGSVDGKVVIF